MIKTISEKWNVNNFSTMIPSFVFLDRMIMGLRSDRSSRLSEVHEFESKEEETDEKFEGQMEELDNIKVEIPALEFMVPTISKPEVKKEYEELISAKYKRKKFLEDREKENDSYAKFEKTLKYATAIEEIKAMDEWVESVGAWFEEGHLGEGSFTYNDKIFSYPKS